jgi:hypothetical protein
MMPLYLISHELTRPRAEYAAFWEALGRDEATQVLDSAWILRSPRTAIHLLQQFRRLIKPEDRLLVVELSQAYAWSNPMADPCEV